MIRRMWCVLSIIILVAGCTDSETKDQSDSAASTSAADTSGPPVRVEANVDQTQVGIGDKVTYTVKVVHDPDVDVVFPAVLDQFADWVIVDPGYWRAEPDLGRKKVRRMDVVLDPGIGPLLVIPPSEIRFKRPGRESFETARTAEITVEVAATAAEPGEFREPTDSFRLPEPPAVSRAKDERRILLLTGACLLLITLTAFFVLRTRRRKTIPPPLAHETAERELERLVAMDLPSRGEMREFFYRLTDIMRRYIEARFRIMAPEQTTEEFLVAVRSHPALGLEHKRLLEELLTSADLVKFARWAPPVEESAKALASVRAFIQATRSAARETSEEVSRAV